MSEKRFTHINVLGNPTIWDKKNDKMYIQYDEETTDEIVDLLNEQQATISTLKEENEQLKHWNKCLAEKRHEEKEHNDSLIKKLIGKIDFLERIIDGDL